MQQTLLSETLDCYTDSRWFRTQHGTEPAPRRDGVLVASMTQTPRWLNLVLVMIFIMAIVAIPLIPQARLVGPARLLLTPIGLVLFVFGLSWVVLAARTRRAVGLECDQLVTWGVYGICRHPIWLGTLCYYAGLALATGAALALVFWPVLASLLVIMAIFEEHYLVGRKFPEEYVKYRTQVPAFVSLRVALVVAAVVVVATTVLFLQGFLIIDGVGWAFLWS